MSCSFRASRLMLLLHKTDLFPFTYHYVLCVCLRVLSAQQAGGLISPVYTIEQCPAGISGKSYHCTLCGNSDGHFVISINYGHGLSADLFLKVATKCAVTDLPLVPAGHCPPLWMGLF